MTCSTVDPSTNTLSLPDVPVKDASVIIAELDKYKVLGNSNLDIYTVPSTPNCGGTVLALDFCYSESIRDDYDAEKHILTLLTLNRIGSSFNVTDVIDVQSRPRQDNCSDHTFPDGFMAQYCCGRYRLDREFGLPSGFAVTMYSPPPGTSRQMLTYRDMRVNDFGSEIGGTGIPNVGSIINAVASERQLAMFNLVIGEFVLLLQLHV